MNPWPTEADRRRFTAEARGDNAKIADLVNKVRRFQREFPYGSWPSIPPVAAPVDANGNSITLDCEVIVNRHDRTLGPWRGKVVGIGDEGLPGIVLLRTRPHGSNYVSGAQAARCEAHVFDDYAWLRAEEAAAKVYMHRNIDLAECLWGHFHFDGFKKETTRQYLSALSPTPPDHLSEKGE